MTASKISRREPRPYGRKKHAARCVESHAVTMPASVLQDQNGRELCAVPARFYRVEAGEVATFSTAAALANFLKANPGKWERAE